MGIFDENKGKSLDFNIKICYTITNIAVGFYFREDKRPERRTAMNTTDDFLEKDAEQEEFLDAAVTNETPEAGDDMDIPESFFAGVNEEDFVAVDAEDDAEDTEEDEGVLFEMDYSDVEKEDAKEEERLRKKELKAEAKKARKEKTFFNLMVRILALVMGPVIVLSMYYIIDSVSSAKKLTHELVYGEMEGLTVSAVEAFTVVAHGDYSYSDGTFYKGTTDMEMMYEYLDDMGEKAGVDVMVIFGDTIVMTTHDMGLMEAGDIIYTMEDGEIIHE